MASLIKSCQCEDWPLCEHADDYAYTAEEWHEMNYCGDCGVSHVGECSYPDYDEEEVEDE